jgi:hypothetical protein
VLWWDGKGRRLPPAADDWNLGRLWIMESGSVPRSLRVGRGARRLTARRVPAPAGRRTEREARRVDRRGEQGKVAGMIAGYAAGSIGSAWPPTATQPCAPKARSRPRAARFPRCTGCSANSPLPSWPGLSSPRTRCTPSVKRRVGLIEDHRVHYVLRRTEATAALRQLTKTAERLPPVVWFTRRRSARGRRRPRPAEEPQRRRRPPDARRAAAGGTPLKTWRKFSSGVIGGLCPAPLDG